MSHAHHIHTNVQLVPVGDYQRLQGTYSPHAHKHRHRHHEHGAHGPATTLTQRVLVTTTAALVSIAAILLIVGTFYPEMYYYDTGTEFTAFGRTFERVSFGVFYVSFDLHDTSKRETLAYTDRINGSLSGDNSSGFDPTIAFELGKFLRSGKSYFTDLPDGDAFVWPKIISAAACSVFLLVLLLVLIPFLCLFVVRAWRGKHLDFQTNTEWMVSIGLSVCFGACLPVIALYAKMRNEMYDFFVFITSVSGDDVQPISYGPSFALFITGCVLLACATGCWVARCVLAHKQPVK